MGCSKEDVLVRIRTDDMVGVGELCLHWDWNGGDNTTGKHFGLNQDWNGGPTRTGKPFFLTRDGMEVSSNYKGKYFVRVFNLCKGGILPYKGIGIQYFEKWRREIIM